MSALADRGHVVVDGVRLEYRLLGPQPRGALTLVLLHEGLGCVDLWRNFPDRLAAAMPECSVFAYSRRGYGRSDAVELPRPLDYMQREAREVELWVLPGATEVQMEAELTARFRGAAPLTVSFLLYPAECSWGL